MEIEAKVSTRIPTKHHGTYRIILYTNNLDDKEHMALVFGSGIHSRTLRAGRSLSSDSGEPDSSSSSFCSDNTCVIPETHLPLESLDKICNAVLTRIHSCCFTGETLLSSRCDCAVSFLILILGPTT